MASMATVVRSRSVIKPLSNFTKSISTFPFLSQEPQLADPPQQPSSTTGAPPLPPLHTPSTWRNPLQPPPPSSSTSSLIPLNFLHQTAPSRIEALSHNNDGRGLMNVFADWMTSQRWNDMKQLFEFWVRTLDKYGKPNKPDTGLYNHYLRANLMIGASAGELLDLVARMEEYGITPDTASFNLVLKAMYHARETEVAEKLIERMLHTGKDFKDSLPDDESYDLVIGMLLLTDQIDAALKYIDLTLKSGYMLSVNVFGECVRSCVNKGRLDTLVSIIERCKKMDQNKALCPPWNLCTYIADIAMQADNSELAYYALEFMAKWIHRGEHARPPVLLSVDEGLLVSALATAGRTFNSRLLDGSWDILKRSLGKKKVPNPESYLAKIFALASLGNLQKAFSTLAEFEKTHSNSTEEGAEDLFSPFTSLNPLVVACSKKGFVTLDSVYYQLENLSRANQPYKSVAALNCIILGCANIWDVDRAYQTFAAINATFGLTPNIHSYNALIHAFGKIGKRDEATKVFEHFVGSGLKPNVMTYSLLIDAHLVKRDPKAALTVIETMVIEGYQPTKEMLKKVRRRCIRELDYECNDKVDSLARDFKIRMGTDTRRDLLFNLDYSTDYA